jgi:hypothetical protein
MAETRLTVMCHHESWAACINWHEYGVTHGLQFCVMWRIAFPYAVGFRAKRPAFQVHKCKNQYEREACDYRQPCVLSSIPKVHCEQIEAGAHGYQFAPREYEARYSNTEIVC